MQLLVNVGVEVVVDVGDVENGVVGVVGDVEVVDELVVARKESYSFPLVSFGPFFLI